ncbi:hypothetical protein [Streptomyces yangpuensis]|uniref:hypothetical protein n=1 Tax=Streptomyces yangpuensis TaxID=1648182 RepID=UPI003662993A
MLLLGGDEAEAVRLVGERVRRKAQVRLFGGGVVPVDEDGLDEAADLSGTQSGDRGGEQATTRWCWFRE